MTGKLVRVIKFSYIVLNHVRMWLATRHNVFFLSLEIAKFSYSVFFYLKWKIKKSVSGTLHC